MGQTEIPFYYNTNKLDSSELLKVVFKAKGLEKTVYDFFAANPTSAFIWSEVMDNLKPKPNESSLKRAISNLAKKGWLIKTDELINSIYGAPAHKHKLNLELKE